MDWDSRQVERVSRRAFLGLSVAGLAAGSVVVPRSVSAQAPRRGGTVTIRAWDPPHFDPHLTHNYKTHVAYSFTHSRLVRHKAGPAIAPGSFVLEGDLAESWTQPTETTYVFKLRRGAKWHARPPVNGRELTADDVVYSVERFRTIKGNANAYMLAALERVEAVDSQTVKFTLKEPSAWFLDALAQPMAVPIVAHECAEKFGDLKKAEAVVGTGPWMLEKYETNVRMSFVRHPGYFLAGQPHLDRVELVVDEDNASRMAAFLAGKYELGWEFPGVINRVDWLQIKDTLRQRRPNLRTLEAPTNVMTRILMRTDKTPFSDARVRQAISLAVNRQAMIDAVLEGVGVSNGAVPVALKDWALRVDQLGDGAKYYRHDPAAAKKLLAAAGYANGFSTTMDFHSYGSSTLVDSMQLVLKDLKSVGIDAKLNQKEYGAFVASVAIGKYDAMALGPQQPFLDPDGYLFSSYFPESPRNVGHVNDPVATDLLVRQRRTADPAKRRELVYELQRYLATQQHYVQMPSAIAVYVWDGALRNYGPNLGYDYGGRLQAAWLDR
jgi:peptide/nickel transport system substrate-binding protein